MRTLAPGRVSAYAEGFETGENWRWQAISRLCPVLMIGPFLGYARELYGAVDRLFRRECGNATRCIAAALHASGLAEARKVAVYSPNNARAFIAMLAIFRSGRVWVPLNARNTVDDNAAFMNYTDEGLLYPQQLRERGSAVAKR